MNRNDEFTEFMKELDMGVPEISESIQRGSRRKARKNFLYQPLLGLAAVFALFVLSVNLFAPVAYACSKVPVLKELAKAVTFSRSLSDAVENEYVQEMNLKQTKRDITAEIAYLIVDQKQVNVFYRFESERYDKLNAYCNVLDEDGNDMEGHSVSSGGFGLQNEELRCATIDFYENNVPGVLCLQLEVFGDYENENRDFLEVFDFLLEFDPEFTAKGRVYAVNQTVELDGQQISIESIEVYPTHARVNVADAPENTAWLKALMFYMETEKGEVFTTAKNGVTAMGSPDSPSMVSYYAESTYFYDAKQLNLVITGALWQEKGRERIKVDLETGETDPLPDNVAFMGAERERNGWLVLRFKEPFVKGEPSRSAFGFQCYDVNEEEYSASIGLTMGDEELQDGEQGWYVREYCLEDYAQKEIWLTTQYTSCRMAKDAIEITVNMSE